MAGEDLNITIGAREIYDRLVSIEAQLTQALDTSDHEGYEKLFTDHESRLRTIERLLWGIPASVVVAVIAIVLKIG